MRALERKTYHGFLTAVQARLEPTYPATPPPPPRARPCIHPPWHEAPEALRPSPDWLQHAAGEVALSVLVKHETFSNFLSPIALELPRWQSFLCLVTMVMSLLVVDVWRAPVT